MSTGTGCHAEVGRQCEFPQCSRPHKAKGYCEGHYTQVRDGRELRPLSQKAISLTERFWRRVKKTEDCWYWAGAKNDKGYGQMWRTHKVYYAHRLSWEMSNGPIPEGFLVDHMCHKPSCVNPAHLRLATASQNLQNREGSYSSSGIRGVYRNKQGRSWMARASVNGVTAYLGSYSTREEAESVVVKWRRENMPYSIKDQIGDAT